MSISGNRIRLETTVAESRRETRLIFKSFRAAHISRFNVLYELKNVHNIKTIILYYNTYCILLFIIIKTRSLL